MVTILIILALIYLVYFFLGPYIGRWLRRRAEERLRRMVEQMFGIDPDRATRASRAGGNARSYTGSDPRQGYSRRHSGMRTSRMPRGIGEYVEFTEISEPMPAPSVDPRHTPREPQIEDAVWEDI